MIVGEAISFGLYSNFTIIDFLGDHHPITPLVATYSGTFHDSDASKLYGFIVKYFISTVICSDKLDGLSVGVLVIKK